MEGLEASFHMCYKEIWVSWKLGYFPVELCPKLRTLKISPWQVDHIVNFVFIVVGGWVYWQHFYQLTSRGCLLQIGQL